MTVEQPNQTGHVWFINAVDYFPVDVFVNDAPEPVLTDLTPLKVGPIFEVDGSPARPYQVYSFQVRRKDDPSRGQLADGVLAEASIELQQQLSYTAVFHFADQPLTYGLSIFANDFTPSSVSRLEVRHVGFNPAIDWTIEPKPGADPQIPADTRSGTLMRGQWQQATEMVENDYRLEFRIDGELFAFQPDLELDHEKMLVTYFVGNPLPDQTEINDLENYLLEQEFKLPPGPPLQAVVTDPAAPVSQTNSNQPIAFAADPIEVFQTNPTSGQVTATDPDGRVTGIAIETVQPNPGTIEIPDAGVEPSGAIGAPATAVLCVGGDTPAGQYDVTVRTNPDSLADSATFTVPVTVKEITVQRLRSQVDLYQTAGAIDAPFATELQDLLDQVGASISVGLLSQACDQLTSFSGMVEARSGEAIMTAASDALEREAGAFRTSLNCGNLQSNSESVCPT